MNLTIQIHCNVPHFISYDNIFLIVCNYYIHFNSDFIDTIYHHLINKNYPDYVCLYQYSNQPTFVHLVFINIHSGYCFKNSSNGISHSYHFSHLYRLIYYALCLVFFLMSLFYYLLKKIHDFRELQRGPCLLYFIKFN